MHSQSTESVLPPWDCSGDIPLDCSDVSAAGLEMVGWILVNVVSGLDAGLITGIFDEPGNPFEVGTLLGVMPETVEDPCFEGVVAPVIEVVAGPLADVTKELAH